MIDMHSHILPNIDDGSYSLEESVKIVKELYEAGFTDIVSTSHFIEDESYNASKQTRERLIKDLTEKLQEENIDVHIYNGAEAYVSTELYRFIEQDILPTINNTRYLLFEFPMHSEIIYLEEIIYELREKGIIPIIAHPERYSYVQENPKMLENLIEQGVLFQANYGSIIGNYGRKAEKTLKKLLKNNMIHFLGTDVHRSGYIGVKIKDAVKKMEKLIGKEKLEVLSTINPQKVLKNENI